MTQRWTGSNHNNLKFGLRFETVLFCGTLLEGLHNETFTFTEDMLTALRKIVAETVHYVYIPDPDGMLRIEGEAMQQRALNNKLHGMPTPLPKESQTHDQNLAKIHEWSDYGMRAAIFAILSLRTETYKMEADEPDPALNYTKKFPTPEAEQANDTEITLFDNGVKPVYNLDVPQLVEYFQKVMAHHTVPMSTPPMDPSDALGRSQTGCRPDAYVLPWYAAQNDQGQKMCPFAFSAAQVQIMLGGIHINKIWLTNDLTKAEEVARKIQEAEEKISQGRDNKASFFASTESALTLKTAENWGIIPSLEVKGILNDMAREISALKGHPGTNKAIIRTHGQIDCKIATRHWNSNSR